MARICECGCGKPIKGNKGKRFYDSVCRVRAFHARKIAEAKASVVNNHHKHLKPGEVYVVDTLDDAYAKGDYFPYRFTKNFIDTVLKLSPKEAQSIGRSRRKNKVSGEGLETAQRTTK